MIILKLISLIFIAVLFAGLFFVFSVVHNIRTLLNLRKRTSPDNQTSSQQSQQSSYSGSQQSSYSGSGQSSYSGSHRGGETVYNTSSQRKRKIIPHDEGEYVDFEEIK